MRLSDEQLRSYATDGFLAIEKAFDAREVTALLSAFERDCEVPGEHLILEERRRKGDDPNTVRGVYGSHLRQPEFAALMRDRRLLAAAHRLFAENLYVYQLKI